MQIVEGDNVKGVQQTKQKESEYSVWYWTVQKQNLENKFVNEKLLILCLLDRVSSW